MQQTNYKIKNCIQKFNHISCHKDPMAAAMIQEIIKPETTLEKTIIQQKEWLTGAFWGEPRHGHPEGKVIFHIREVLDNVEKISKNPLVRQKLRLISILHDNFKHLEESERPRLDWSKHHAVFARNFATNFIDEENLLNIIELHDEAYYSWHSNKVHQNKERKEVRLNNLINKLGRENLQLFYLFFKCDTFTGDKTILPVKWFEETVKEIEIIRL